MPKKYLYNRPTIDEILEILKSDPGLLENGVDEALFNDYFDFVDSFLSHSEPENNHSIKVEIEQIIQLHNSSLV